MNYECPHCFSRDFGLFEKHEKEESTLWLCESCKMIYPAFALKLEFEDVKLEKKY